MTRSVRFAVAIAFLAAVIVMLSAPDASAVPSYSRRYGMECSTCHTMWGALNGTGVQFRLSGYRAMSGVDLPPLSKDIELSPGVVIPSTLPLSLITGVGFDYRNERRNAADGIRTDRTGSSLSLEDASLFLTSPIGEHLSAFLEFPMYESKAWECTPTGPGEANDKTTGSIQLPTETPVFEVAKLFWNNLLGSKAPRDSVNLLAGITHLPLAYSPGKVRLSINQYPIYERRALDLISPKSVDSVFSTELADSLFRLSEPQTVFEVNGMVVPGKPVTEVGNRNTLWFEYHAGIANGSNSQGDINAEKDLYGRFVMRRYNQSLGIFAYYSPDMYSNALRDEGATAGITSGLQLRNSATRIGPDMTLSLVPLGIPVWLENQYLFNRESNPTGYGRAFSWQGGFHQLNWQISKKTLTYARYDYVSGKSFDDGHNPAVRPNETDEVVGLQHLIQANVKFAVEYRHHQFKDRASTPNTARLADDGLTTRVMVGF